MSEPTSFPKKETLWRGAILGGIVNATMSAGYPMNAVYGYWSRNHYIMNDVQGGEAHITFAGGHWYPDGPLIALFHDVHSPRFLMEERIPDRYFADCPEYQRFRIGSR